MRGDMQLTANFTRRSCLRRFLCAVGGAGLLRGAALPRLTWDASLPSRTGGVPNKAAERRYRADAQVSVLGITLFHKAGVGGGSTVWRESSLPQGGMLRFLEFTGFSLPDHAAGLNRIGFIREMARLADTGASECIYFGLMTSSPEESAEEARKAIESHSAEAVYSAIEGRVAGDAVENVGAHFRAPAKWTIRNEDELIEEARTALAAAPKTPLEVNSREAGEATFLQSIARLLREPAPSGASEGQTSYLYNGRRYHLSLRCSADPKATAQFRERGIIGQTSEVLRAAGQVRREVGGKEHNFRLWFEPGADMPVPLRIEYQAKSYLRLMFEAEG
jgi:hypothetical protein